MVKRDEISSTERLLDLIRDDSKVEYDVSDRSSRESISRRIKGIFSNPVSFRKTISVGVDLGHTDLKMIKIHRISDQN